MKNACLLADKIVKSVEEYSECYISQDGKIATTEQSLALLNEIIEEGFVLYKHLVEKKLYEAHNELIVPLNAVAEFIEKLSITKENAQKLHLSSAVQLWQQAKIAIAILACTVLDCESAGEKVS